MERGWYIKFGDKVEGPFSDVMLKSRAQRGTITPTTEVRLGSDGHWVAAGQVKGLFASREPESDIDEWLKDDRRPSSSSSAAARNPKNVAEPPPEIVQGQAGMSAERKPDGHALPHTTSTSGPPSAAASSIDVPVEVTPPTPAKVSMLVPCGDCGKPISPRASLCPNCGCPVTRAEPEPRYDGLRFYAAISRVLAVVVLIACLIGFIIALDARARGAVTVEVVVTFIVAGAIWPLWLWASADLADLLMDIERNTRR